METKVYSRALMIMIIVLISGFSFAADRNVPGTYATIQLAIDASDPGDNVIVAAGTYTENLTIDEEVTITGASNTTTFIVGHHTVTADNVTVTKFDLTNSTSYVFILNASGGALSDFSVTYCVFNLAGYGGIHIGGDAGSANAISNVTIDNNSFDGPASMASNPFKIGGFFGAGSGQQVTNVDFTNNTVTEGSIPINLKDEDIDDILIDNNTFTTTDGLVYVWSDNTPTGVLSNFVFTNNKADATNNYGVGLGLINVAGTYGDANFGTGNTVNNNSFVGIDGAYGFLTVSLLGTYTTYSLSANCNWWGELGFNADDQVNSNVTKTTYLENGTDSNPGDPGFDPSASCVSVTCSDPTSPDYNFAVTPAEDSWATHTATLITNACVVYKVTCTVGKQYTFKTGCDNGATAAFDTFMELFDATGTWVSQNDDGCSSYRSTITWVATETVAYIKIRGYNSTQYGAVTVAYEYTAAAAGGTCKTPTDYDAAVTPSTSWVTHGSNPIASDGCYIYEVTCTVGKQYTFKTGCDDGATADFDTFIELFDAAGTWVSQNDDGCTEYRSTITWVASETTAYVKVRGYNSNSSGAFTVAYKYTDAAAGGTCKTPTDSDETLPAPTTSWQMDGSTAIASDACHVYKVAVTLNNTYTFKTGCTNGSADFDTFIELYDGDGEWVTQDDDGCSVPASGDYTSKLDWTATYTGYAYVKVRGYNSSTYGSFILAYKYVAGGTCKTPTDSDETLTTPTANWQTDGSTAIVSNACYVYKVAVTSTYTYTFKTGCTEGTADFDTFIELYDGDGDWLTQDDDGCSVPASGDYTSKVEWTATYSGWAYVKVRGYNSGAFGSFTLAYKYVTPGPDVITLGNGENLAKNLVKVYPNPANQSFTIVTQEPVTFTRILISEFTGRLAKSWTLDQPATSLRIESTNFAPGVYILSIETSDGWIRKKVSIIR